jgi:hypothetical protein
MVLILLPICAATCIPPPALSPSTNFSCLRHRALTLWLMQTANMQRLMIASRQQCELPFSFVGSFGRESPARAIATTSRKI